MAESGPAEHPDVEQLRADLLRAIRWNCPPHLANQAEDLAHIAICRVLALLATTGDSTRFTRSYLYRTAYTVVIDEIRKRRNEVPLEPESPVRSPDDDPEKKAMTAEVRKTIRECVAALAPPRRRAVLLHLLGHSAEEISDLLACGRKRTYNLIHRGLGDLRARLLARGVTPFSVRARGGSR